jgi:hypothetical protein
LWIAKIYTGLDGKMQEFLCKDSVKVNPNLSASKQYLIPAVLAESPNPYLTADKPSFKGKTRENGGFLSVFLVLG